jgi:chorismate dehydratase
VFIFSDRPIEEVEVLYLDPQSRTSNNLAKVLLKHYYKVYPVLKLLESGEQAQAFVEIGDRTFGKHDHYPFTYDLAAEWKKFTGLPFVFAVWASNKTLPAGFIDSFNEALSYGLSHRYEVIRSLSAYPNFDLEDYLMNKIDYDLDTDKRKALEMFLELVEKLDK